MGLKIQTSVAIIMACLYLLSICERGSCAAYGFDLAGYEDAGDGMLTDLPDKRGMCRPGFTYSAILRDCVPSLGVLRGRGRAGRGRRGSGWRTQ